MVTTFFVTIVLIIVFSGITAAEYNTKMSFVSTQLSNAIDKAVINENDFNSTAIILNSNTKTNPFPQYSNTNANFENTTYTNSQNAENNSSNGDTNSESTSDNSNTENNQQTGANIRTASTDNSNEEQIENINSETYETQLNSSSDNENNSSDGYTSGSIAIDTMNILLDNTVNSYSTSNNNSTTRNTVPQIGADSTFDSDEYIPIIIYRVDHDIASLIAVDDSSASLTEDVMRKAASIVVDADDGFVRSEEIGLCYLKTTINGIEYVAFTDVDSVDSYIVSVSSAFFWVVIIIAFTFTILSWFLSGWMIKPVKETWSRQTQFVADASHELKTPVSVIIANCGIILAKDNLDQDTRKWTETTLSEAESLKELVGDMLYLATNDAEKGRGKEIFDVGRETARIAMQFETRAFERECLMSFDNVESGIYANADKQGIKKMIGILVDNACKYSNKKTTISIEVKEDKKHAIISVSDYGKYIPKEEEKDIFERFYRADASRTGDNGYGLGLAMAKDIVSRENGKISVKSNKKDGYTTFTVKLPKVKPPKTEHKKEKKKVKADTNEEQNNL